MANSPVNQTIITESRNRTQRPATSHKGGRRWASMQEAADYVGVGLHTVRDWIAKGKIRGYRINSRVIRVDLDELDHAFQPFGGEVA